MGPPGSWTWASIICPRSQRLVSKGADTIPSKAAAIYDGKMQQEDEDVQLAYSDQANVVPLESCRSSAKRAGVSTRPACTSSQGSCRWMPRARLDLREGMDALHCAASHGHWRFNTALLAQIAEEIQAPDRAAQGTGEGAIAIIRTWVSKSMVMTQLIAQVPFPAHAQVCVFLRCL